MTLNLHHLAIKVRDLSSLERFYTDVLGLSVERRLADAAGIPRAVWFRLGSALLMLERSGLASQVNPRGFDQDIPGLHVAALTIALADRQAWRARLEKGGVTEIRESEYSLFFCDPEGNCLALSHYPESKEST